MSDFVSEFWAYYIAIIVVASIVWLGYVLYTQSHLKVPKGQQVQVTGHVWDGDLEEYNNPLPRWWMMLFYITLAFAAGYLVFYPGIWRGTLGWTKVRQYEQEVAAKNDEIKPMYDKYMKMDIPTLSKDAAAHESGQRLFLTYCMQCHGSDARGAKGFPNLTDDDWLYGGTPDKIVETITGGRGGQMPAFGAAFGEEKIKDVANYVLKINGRKEGDGPGDFDAIRASRGEATFKQVCAACHQPDGHGSQTIGAPNLTDKIWLYGGSKATIIETITNGRKNRMPAWKDALGEGKIHLLAAYVYSLSRNPETASPKQ